jgi:DNA helicase-2/ATP-dependent DNA helicase PcrA
MNVTKIFGPPGTGKTTKLLSIVEEALASGIAPERIAYLSFSRKAADEAVERACERFKLEKERFIYFRTLHSLGFMQQSFSMEQQMQFEDYEHIAKCLGLEVTKFSDEEDSTYGNKDGDNCMSICSLARARMISIEDEWRNANKQVSIKFPVVQQWFCSVDNYKKKYGKKDFNDMLEGYKRPLDVDIFIVDEAQDLSNLQWDVVLKASANADKIYVAGDDDQCIYNWNGANVSKFLDMPFESELVLPQSWRVPSEIMPVANRIVSRISKRKEKSWLPAGAGGSVNEQERLYDLPIDSGSWMLLARNIKHLRFYENYLQRAGYIYENNKYRSDKRSIKLEDASMITSWERLHKGESIGNLLANQIIKLIDKKAPMIRFDNVEMKDMPFPEEIKNKHWYDIFNKSMSAWKVEYIRSCLRNGQKLTEKPRILISTIHRVKGGEAESVAVLPDYSYITSQFKDTDDEHRVQYVAVTRAKKNLYILQPNEKDFYEH